VGGCPNGAKIDHSRRQHAARLTLLLAQSAFRMLRRSLAETTFKLFGDCVVAFPGREWKTEAACHALQVTSSLRHKDTNMMRHSRGTAGWCRVFHFLLPANKPKFAPARS
jgi:hypothetical protein